MDKTRITKLIFNISMYALGALLLLLIILTSVIGAEEITLKVVGWITVAFLLSALVSFIVLRLEKK